jgi:hypothetical protein
MYARHDPATNEAVSRIAARTRCEMFHSGALAKAIHDDRLREIERVTRDRRLLMASDEAWTAPELPPAPKPLQARRAAVGRSGSACEPA